MFQKANSHTTALHDSVEANAQILATHSSMVSQHRKIILDDLLSGHNCASPLNESKASLYVLVTRLVQYDVTDHTNPLARDIQTVYNVV